MPVHMNDVQLVTYSIMSEEKIVDNIPL